VAGRLRVVANNGRGAAARLLKNGSAASRRMLKDWNEKVANGNQKKYIRVTQKDNEFQIILDRPKKLRHRTYVGFAAVERETGQVMTCEEEAVETRMHTLLLDDCFPVSFDLAHK